MKCENEMERPVGIPVAITYFLCKLCDQPHEAYIDISGIFEEPDDLWPGDFAVTESE